MASVDVRLIFHAKNLCFQRSLADIGQQEGLGAELLLMLAQLFVVAVLCYADIFHCYLFFALLFCFDPFSLCFLFLFYNYLPDVTLSGTLLHIKVSNPLQKGKRMIHSFHIELFKPSGEKHGEQI